MKGASLQRYDKPGAFNCTPWCVRLVLCGLMLGVTTMGAGAQSIDQSRPSPAHSITQHKNTGAVRLTLAVDRQTIEFADHVRLTLSVEAPPQIVVTLPAVADTLGPFTVRSQRPLESLPTASQTRRWRREYILEAQDVGVLTIPPLTIALQEAGQSKATRQIETDALTVTVTSLLPEDADVTAPKDIAPPVSLERRGVPPWVWIVAGVLAGCGLLVVGYWWYCRQRGSTAADTPPQPAHQLALEALERLQREELIVQQRIEEFYVRLSDILRRYVEWRFGLRAPEQTTEEFLATVLTTGGLIVTHRHLLDAFLRHCDLVKFARHRPTPDDMQQAWESARVFVEQTADAHVVVAASASGVAVL